MTLSTGAEQLLGVLREIFPNQIINLNYHIRHNGESFFIDFAILKLNLLFEYDGEQHFVFNSKFFNSKDDFLKSRKKDISKDKMAEELSYILIRVSYKDKISKDLLLNLLKNKLNA